MNDCNPPRVMSKKKTKKKEITRKGANGTSLLIVIPAGKEFNRKNFW